MINFIAISVSDNDFHSTFTNLLTTMKNVLDEDVSLSQETVTKIIVSGMKFHYSAFQNKYNYKHKDGDSYEDHFNQVVKYLADCLVIKYNDEGIEQFEKCTSGTDFCNGEWYFLDVRSGEVYTS